MSDLMRPMVPEVRRVATRVWFREALVSASRWRRPFLFLLVSQVLLVGFQLTAASMERDRSLLPGVVVYLMLQVLAHGVALALVIHPDSRLREAIGLSIRRVLQQGAVALILVLLAAVAGFVLAFPLLYGLAFTPMDPAANRMADQLILASDSLVAVLLLSRLMTAQVLVIMGSGPFRAIGAAWQNSRGAWRPGLIGAVAVLGLFSLTLFITPSVDSQPYFTLVVVAGFSVTMTVAAIIEESYHRVTARSPRHEGSRRLPG